MWSLWAHRPQALFGRKVDLAIVFWARTNFRISMPRSQWGCLPSPSVFPAFVFVPCGLLQFVENMDFLVLRGQVPKLIRCRHQRHGPELCPLLERVEGHGLATAPGFPCHPQVLHGQSRAWASVHVPLGLPPSQPLLDGGPAQHSLNGALGLGSELGRAHICSILPVTGHFAVRGPSYVLLETSGPCMVLSFPSPLRTWFGFPPRKY